MEYGDEHLKYYLNRKERGLSGPLDIYPKVSDACYWYFEIYEFIFYSKSELVPSPLSELLKLAKSIELIGPFDEFLHVLQQLDRTFIAHLKAKQKND